MKAVIFLQNAWSALYADRTWPRASWLEALASSRSGQRLRVLTGAAPGVTFWYDNTTPVVGATPGSIVPFSLPHMSGVLASQRPDLVVCMGAHAKRAWRSLQYQYADQGLPVLFLPHPTYRVLTNALLELAGGMLREGWEGERELRQARPAAQ